MSIAVHERYKNSVKSWEEADEEIITLEMEKNGENCMIIGVYAPSNDAEERVKDKFYERMEQVLAGINSNKEIMILGDLNARTRKKKNT